MSCWHPTHFRVQDRINRRWKYFPRALFTLFKASIFKLLKHIHLTHWSHLALMFWMQMCWIQHSGCFIVFDCALQQNFVKKIKLLLLLMLWRMCHRWKHDFLSENILWIYVENLFWEFVFVELKINWRLKYFQWKVKLDCRHLNFLNLILWQHQYLKMTTNTRLWLVKSFWRLENPVWKLLQESTHQFDFPWSNLKCWSSVRISEVIQIMVDLYLQWIDCVPLLNPIISGNCKNYILKLLHV